jgi:Cysteine-rich CPCC
VSNFPCPACGFLTFDRPAGSYELCPLCNWEDDPVQLLCPGMGGGANRESLYEAQQRLLTALPMEVQLKRGFRRDATWRPLRPDEARSGPGEPQTGRQYFDAIPYDSPGYYWQSSPGPAA